MSSMLAEVLEEVVEYSRVQRIAAHYYCTSRVCTAPARERDFPRQWGRACHAYVHAGTSRGEFWEFWGILGDFGGFWGSRDLGISTEVV